MAKGPKWSRKMVKGTAKHRLSSAKFAGVLFFLVLGLGGALLKLRYPGVVLSPALFFTEYLKFLATVTTIFIGWGLVHVFWEETERRRFAGAFRATLQDLTQELKDRNWETMQLIAGHAPAMSPEDRDRYVEANINRQRDLVRSMQTMLGYHSHLSQVDPGFMGRALLFVANVSREFDALASAPYRHVHDLVGERQQVLEHIGKLAEVFYVGVEEGERHAEGS